MFEATETLGYWGTVTTVQHSLSRRTSLLSASQFSSHHLPPISIQPLGDLAFFWATESSFPLRTFPVSILISYSSFLKVVISFIPKNAPFICFLCSTQLQLHAAKNVSQKQSVVSSGKLYPCISGCGKPSLLGICTIPAVQFSSPGLSWLGIQLVDPVGKDCSSLWILGHQLVGC